MLNIDVMQDYRYPNLLVVKISDPQGWANIHLGALDRQDRKELVADLEQFIQKLSYDFDEDDNG